MSMNAELASHVGLKDYEWQSLCERLGRLPSLEELHMIGVMWSEHCSYKSTKRFLKQLKTTGPTVIQGPGENAGLVRFDEKRALAFKVESHNHPSFVEPFQGAATGVGGILRDIFTMGARPIAVGNYLRFGDLKSPQHQFLLDGVISGIAHYGNCVGIPTVAGEIHSGSRYDGNILVNVFALGVIDPSKIFRSNTAKPNCSVMIWGAKTGRDGIHGASLLASADFSESNAGDGHKVRVQVGDPFKEKCLMEACLHAMDHLADDLIAIQDMGAAGLTCSTLEISDKSKIGMRVDLSLVPVRETGMEGYELLLSESQERMLAIVRKGSEDSFQKLLEKWDCDGAVIGETTSDGRVVMTFNEKTVVDLPVSKIIDAPDATDLPEPHWEKSEITGPAVLKSEASEFEKLCRLMEEPSIASKASIYQRYDSTVGNATVLGPGHDVAVLWIGDERSQDFSGVAFKGNCPERWMAVDPEKGIEAAMLTSLRSLALVGAQPLGFTDGVNLGNPYDPATLGALEMSVRGMNRVAEAFDLPCVSGNVSLYNQTQKDGVKVNIPPTIFPVLVGRVPDLRRLRPSLFQEAGSEVWLIEVPGQTGELSLTGSLYEHLLTGRTQGVPSFSIEAEKALWPFILKGLHRDLFLSLRTVSEGGLAVSLAKACAGLAGERASLGFVGDLLKIQGSREAFLFGEWGARIIVEVSPDRRADMMALRMETGVEVRRLGNVVAEDIFELKPLLSGAFSVLEKAWKKAFV
jgi:phosphoribosylformylglycinamidine synthase